MAKVTYRGVEYDTDRVTPSNKKEVSLTYRGVKHSRADEVLPSYLDAVTA